jgi:hypothetical protein
MTIPALDFVNGAHDELCQVREWLRQPSTETLEACPPALERAVAYLHDLSAQVDPSRPAPELLQPLAALSREIRTAQRLLHSAAAIHFGRLRPITHPDA